MASNLSRAVILEFKSSGVDQTVGELSRLGQAYAKLQSIAARQEQQSGPSTSFGRAVSGVNQAASTAQSAVSSRLVPFLGAAYAVGKVAEAVAQAGARFQESLGQTGSRSSAVAVALGELVPGVRSFREALLALKESTVEAVKAERQAQGRDNRREAALAQEARQQARRAAQNQLDSEGISTAGSARSAGARYILDPREREQQQAAIAYQQSRDAEIQKFNADRETRNRLSLAQQEQATKQHNQRLAAIDQEYQGTIFEQQAQKVSRLLAAEAAFDSEKRGLTLSAQQADLQASGQFQEAELLGIRQGAADRMAALKNQFENEFRLIDNANTEKVRAQQLLNERIGLINNEAAARQAATARKNALAFQAQQFGLGQQEQQTRAGTVGSILSAGGFGTDAARFGIAAQGVARRDALEQQRKEALARDSGRSKEINAQYDRLQQAAQESTRFGLIANEQQAAQASRPVGAFGAQYSAGVSGVQSVGVNDPLVSMAKVQEQLRNLTQDSKAVLFEILGELRGAGLKLVTAQ